MANLQPTALASDKRKAGMLSDQQDTSTLLSMSKILLHTPSTVVPKKDHKKVPGHIANILKVILLHDKFEHNFCKWSLVQTEDRDVLVLTLKSGAVVDSSLVYTICMMYPLRINGPILVKNTMNVEFLHDDPLQVVSVTGEIPQKNVEFQLGTLMHTRKRHKPSSPSETAQSVPMSSHQENSSSTGMTVPDLEMVREKLAAALQMTNSTRVFIDHVDTGLDAGGSWVRFRLSECEKLNLDFIGGFQLAIDDIAVKVTFLSHSSLFVVRMGVRGVFDSLSLHSPYKCRCRRGFRFT